MPSLSALTTVLVIRISVLCSPDTCLTHMDSLTSYGNICQIVPVSGLPCRRPAPSHVVGAEEPVLVDADVGEHVL